MKSNGSDTRISDREAYQRRIVLFSTVKAYVNRLRGSSRMM